MKTLGRAYAFAWACIGLWIVLVKPEAQKLPDRLAEAAVAAIKGGNVAKAERFAEAALVRDPRNTRALAVELEAALRSSAPDRALITLERLLKIDPGRWESIKPLAIELVEQDRARDTFKAIQSRRPEWAADVMVTLNQTSRNYALVADLDAQEPLHQPHFIRRVAGERGLNAAYAIWLDYAEQAGSQAGSWPFDAEFKGATAPAPFNWSRNEAWVEGIEGGGLRLYATGRIDTPLLQQTMLLRPGVYRFTATFKGDPAKDAFYWTLSCAGHGAAVVIKGASAGFNFHTPDSCSGQVLSLYASPSEGAVQADLQRVRIEAVP